MTSRVWEQGSSLAAGTLSIISPDQRVADVMKRVGIVSKGPTPVRRVAREERELLSIHTALHICASAPIRGWQSDHYVASRETLSTVDANSSHVHA